MSDQPQTTQDDPEFELLEVPKPAVLQGLPGFKFKGATQQGSIVIFEYEKPLGAQTVALTITMIGEHYVDVTTDISDLED